MRIKKYAQGDIFYRPFIHEQTRSPVVLLPSGQTPQQLYSYSSNLNQSLDLPEFVSAEETTEAPVITQSPVSSVFSENISVPVAEEPKLTIGTIQYKDLNIDTGKMKKFIEEAQKAGVSFRVTSGLRPNAKTKRGITSHHATGNAIDITPIEGQTGEDLFEAFKSRPKLLQGMRDNGIGILDETTKEMLARTGGTGAHGHIGPDRIALEGFKNGFGKQGGSIPKFQTGGFGQISENPGLPPKPTTGQPYTPTFVERYYEPNENTFYQFRDRFEDHKSNKPKGVLDTSKKGKKESGRGTGKYGITILYDDKGKEIRAVRENDNFDDETGDKYRNNYQTQLVNSLKQKFNNFDSYYPGLQNAIKDIAGNVGQNAFGNTEFLKAVNEYSETLDPNLLPGIAKLADGNLNDSKGLGLRSRMRQAMILSKLNPEDLGNVYNNNYLKQLKSLYKPNR